MKLIDLEVLERDIEECKETIKGLEEIEDYTLLKSIDKYKRLHLYMLICKRVAMSEN